MGSGQGGGGPDDNAAQAGHLIASTLTQGAPSAGRRQEDDYNLVPVTVRRLTPVECARLQGFPDDFNDHLSDTQRYRQYGNAVTVNVTEWIGRQIMEAAGG